MLKPLQAVTGIVEKRHTLPRWKKAKLDILGKATETGSYAPPGFGAPGLPLKDSVAPTY